MGGELAEDVVDVAFDRSDGDEECPGDGLVGGAAGNEAQDFQLALGERFE